MSFRPSTAAFFEAKYRDSADPWSFASSAYEQGSYAVILAGLQHRATETPSSRAALSGCSTSAWPPSRIGSRPLISRPRLWSRRGSAVRSFPTSRSPRLPFASAFPCLALISSPSARSAITSLLRSGAASPAGSSPMLHPAPPSWPRTGSAPRLITACTTMRCTPLCGKMRC